MQAPWWVSWLNRKRWSTLLVGAVLFSIPSNLFVILWDSNAFAGGLRIDYLMVRLYLSMALVLLSTTALVLSSARIELKLTSTVGGVLLGLLIARQIDTPIPAVSLWHAATIGSIFCWSLLLARSRILLQSWVPSVLFGTQIFQVGVGVVQFLTGTSVWGYYLLGEPNLETGYGLAKAQILGGERVLAYGTTAHPNVLAGTLVIGAMLIWTHQHSSTRLRQLAGILAGIGVLITQSLSGAGALLLAGALFRTPRRYQALVSKLAALAVMGIIVAALSLHQHLPEPLASHDSIERRVALSEAALRQWSTQPMRGVGLSMSTESIERFTPKSADRFVQPPHAVPLVWLSETGILGVMTLLILLLPYRRHIWTKNPVLLAGMTPLLLWDHYLLTLTTGLLLLGLVGASLATDQALQQPKPQASGSE